MVISFWELPEDEQPDQEYWLDDEALNQHFEMLKDKREAKARGVGKSEPVPQAPMDQNELTRSLRGK